MTKRKPHEARSQLTTLMLSWTPVDGHVLCTYAVHRGTGERALVSELARFWLPVSRSDLVGHRGTSALQTLLEMTWAAASGRHDPADRLAGDITPAQGAPAPPLGGATGGLPGQERLPGM